MWDNDLADLQLSFILNKGITSVSCIIDIYRKYAWFVPLKDKKCITSTNVFQKNFYEYRCKPNKICID